MSMAAPAAAMALASVEAEERKRVLSTAINAYFGARQFYKRRYDEEYARFWAFRRAANNLHDNFFEIISRFPEKWSKQPAPHEVVTMIFGFFSEEKSPLQLWRVPATSVFVACLRNTIKMLANAWQQMGLNSDYYVPAENPFKQPRREPLLNDVLFRMQGLANFIETFKYNQNTAQTVFGEWDEDISQIARDWKNSADEKTKSMEMQLSRSWLVGMQTLENCFITNFVSSGKTDGRIARLVARRLNVETARIQPAFDQILIDLEAEYQRLQRPPPPPVVVADVKMQEAVAAGPNPSFGLSVFGIPVVPPAFLQMRRPRAPAAPMDISKNAGRARPRFMQQKFGQIRKRWQPIIRHRLASSA